MLPKSFIFLFAFFLFTLPAHGSESICFGRPGHGALQNGAQLPNSGANFFAYSHLAATLGRTYVHSEVKTILLAAYTELEKTAPGKVFVYGETGFKKGGRLRPHRTHQNGLSVDFMVPVMDQHKKSVPLPCSPLNRFGYDIEFDKNGKYKDLSIDFEAMAEHLYQLFLQTEKQGKKIALVIFDPDLLPFVFATERGAFLEKNLPFMKGNAWVRHDEHYHVDFDVPCKPMKKQETGFGK